MDDRESQQAQQPPARRPPFRRVGVANPTTMVDSVESAVQSLLHRWETRQRWQLLLGCCPVEGRRADRAPWRTRLAEFLESNPVHVATLCLILLDLLFTVLDLSTLMVSCSRGEGEGHGGGRAEKIYRWTGVGILGVLCARVAALAVALGWSFLRSPGHVVDAAVMIGALLLEVLKEGAGGDAGGLLVVVSLWRVVRVVEGALELSNEAIEAQIEGVTAQLEVLKDENRRLEEESLEREKRMAELAEELARLKDATTS